jgi:hypothetical protein
LPIHVKSDMAKKKPNRAAVLATLGEQPQTGRKPKRPEKLDARLDQLIKECDRWLRLFREAWFNPGSPHIQLAIGATEQKDLLRRYDEAIEVMQWIAASAEVAEEKLKEGRQQAAKYASGKET